MAQWSNTFSGTGGGNYRLYVNVDILGQEVGNNRTLIRYNCWVQKMAGSGYWSTSASGNTNINGYNPGRSWGSWDFRAYTVRYIAQNEDYWINHDGAGNANPYFGANWNLGGGSVPGSTSTGGNYGMPTINRYANINAFSLTNVTDEKIQVNWGADVNCDYVSWWSSLIDGGAHHDIPVWGSGGFMVAPSKLRSGTQYDFQVAVRRADSGLWTSSGILYATTLPQNGFFMSGAGTGF